MLFEILNKGSVYCFNLLFIFETNKTQVNFMSNFKNLLWET